MGWGTAHFEDIKTRSLLKMQNWKLAQAQYREIETVATTVGSMDRTPEWIDSASVLEICAGILADRTGK